ncbi:MAG: hypothetical protein GY937_13690 [bacterium]|nr:hypothetical protein [bacterium]
MTGRAWGRLARRGLMVLLVLGMGFFIWARLLAGGPVRIIPGGALRGEVMTEPIPDWSMIGSTQYVDVESRARWLPYSRSTWFMVLDGELFILLPRLFGTGLEDRLQEDPSVRIRIEGRVYAGRVSLVSDGQKLGSLLSPLLRRTMAVEVAGDARSVSGEGGLESGGIAIYQFESLGR